MAFPVVSLQLSTVLVLNEVTRLAEVMICTDFKTARIWKAAAEFSQGDQTVKLNCKLELQLDFIAVSAPRFVCDPGPSV